MPEGKKRKAPVSVNDSEDDSAASVPAEDSEDYSVSYENRTVEHLKQNCRERSLKVSGNKAELVERLKHDDSVSVWVEEEFDFCFCCAQSFAS